MLHCRVQYTNSLYEITNPAEPSYMHVTSNYYLIMPLYK